MRSAQPAGETLSHGESSLLGIRCRHRGWRHGMFDALSPGQQRRIGRDPPGAQPADVGDYVAFRRSGACPAFDKEPHRTDPLLDRTLFQAGGRNRPADRLDQQGFAFHRDPHRQDDPHRTPEGARASVRRSRRDARPRRGQGALAAHERRRRRRGCLVT